MASPTRVTRQKDYVWDTPKPQAEKLFKKFKQDLSVEFSKSSYYRSMKSAGKPSKDQIAEVKKEAHGLDE